MHFDINRQNYKYIGKDKKYRNIIFFKLNLINPLAFENDLKFKSKKIYSGFFKNVNGKTGLRVWNKNNGLITYECQPTGVNVKGGATDQLLNLSIIFSYDGLGCYSVPNSCA